MLQEQATATKAASGRWRVVLAKPGQGSSGKYDADVLSKFGPAAFPAKTKSYITHESRDPRDILGTYPDGAYWDGETQELVAELLPRKSYEPLVEELAGVAGLSMYASGSKDADGNIVEIFYNRGNSVDLVGEPGLEGSGIDRKVLERAKTLIEQARTAASADEKQENTVDKEEVKTLLDEQLAPVLKFISEQKQAAEAARKAAEDDKGKAPTVEEAVEAYATAAEKIREAKLFPKQEAALLAVAKKGEDITSLLEDAKAVKDEAVAQVKESMTTGGHRQDATDDNADYGLGLVGW